MEYTCIYCRKPFNINPAEAASAIIDYTFGKKTHNFKCDNCGKDNALTRAQYEAAKIAAETPKPVAGVGAKPIAKPVAKPAPKPSPLMAPSAMPKPAVAPPMTRREATRKTKEDNARRRGEDVSKGSKRNKSDKSDKKVKKGKKK